MRKILLGVATLPLLALLATSCSKETMESKSDLDNVLAFKATAGKQTLSKAGEITIGDIQREGLTVYSYRNDNNNPYNTFSLTYSGAWTYNPTVFHPIAFGLTHYSVYSATNLADYQGGTEFDYTVADTYDAQEDLMVASAFTTHDSQSSATANLTYKHILSQVNFAVQGKENRIVEISNIRVVGVKNSGTFAFGPIGTGGTWDLEDDITDYDYISAGDNATDGTASILYLGNEGNSGNNNKTNALMLMPQSFSAGDGAGFTFDYILRNVNGDDDELDSGNASVNFSGLSMTTWEQGKRYLYNIIFDPILLQFNVEIVENWVDYDGSGGLIDVDTNNI